MPGVKYQTNVEFDDQGRALGSGPIRRVTTVNAVLASLNIVLLAVFLVLNLSHFITHIPLVNVLGWLVAAVVMLAGRLFFVVYWFVTGNDSLFNWLWAMPFHGSPELRAVCGIAPLLAIVALVIVRTIKNSYISPEVNGYLAAGNAAMFLGLVCLLILGW